MDGISKHISYSEATKSVTAIRKGIDNTPLVIKNKRMPFLINIEKMAKLDAYLYL